MNNYWVLLSFFFLALFPGILFSSDYPPSGHKNLLEITIPDVVSNYDETLLRDPLSENLAPFEQTGFPIAVYYSRDLKSPLGLGISGERRNYRAHGESHTLSGIGITDASTALTAITGFVRIGETFGRAQPYVTAGVGWMHIDVNDESTFQPGFRPDVLISRTVKSDKNDAGFEFRGGVSFWLTSNFLIGTELNYLRSINEDVRSLSLAMTAGIQW